MTTEETRARVEALVESLDGVRWEHVSGLSDDDAANLSISALAYALVNTVLTSMPDDAYQLVLTRPERAQETLQRAMAGYPWADTVRSVLAEHRKLREMEKQP